MKGTGSPVSVTPLSSTSLTLTWEGESVMEVYGIPVPKLLDALNTNPDTLDGQ
jgi:hypothetical protein